jgi:hypothetical protein
MRRWLPVSALTGGARCFARAAHRGVTSFLAVAGLVAVVFGLLYRFAAGQIPHLLQAHPALAQGSGLLRGHGAAAPDSYRGGILLAVGGVSLLVAWLIRPRQKT